MIKKGAPFDLDRYKLGSVLFCDDRKTSDRCDSSVCNSVLSLAAFHTRLHIDFPILKDLSQPVGSTAIAPNQPNPSHRSHLDPMYNVVEEIPIDTCYPVKCDKCGKTTWAVRHSLLIS